MSLAFSASDWRSYSSPFPIRSAIPFGDGVLLATDGGIRFRTLDGDFVFHSENGLETSAFYAVVNSPLGVFAVSEFGLVAAMNPDGTSWRVLNRSYVANKVRMVPNGAVVAGSVLTIAFEDRLAFFDLADASSILTIDRIQGSHLSIQPVRALAVRGDSLFVGVGEKAFVRQMDWGRLKSDVRLSDPASWAEVHGGQGVVSLDSLMSPVGQVGGKPLTYEALFDDAGKSLVKWAVKGEKGHFLIGEDLVVFFDGTSGKNAYSDLSYYGGYTLGEPYEVQVSPTGGVFAASIDGYFSYNSGTLWTPPTGPRPGLGSYSSAYTSRMKVLSVLPDGHVFFHIWGHGFFIYSHWGETLEYSYLPDGDYCFDSILDDIAYPVAVMSTPAPDGSGFLTATSSNKGYSVVYFTKDGDVHCAKQVGRALTGGPILAKIDDDGSWVVYVGSRGSALSTEGALDEIRFPAPKSNGGELSDGVLKTYRGIASSLVDMVYDPTDEILWGITTANLVYLDEERDTLISPNSTRGVRGGEFSAIDVDLHGNLWVGTADRGIYRLSRSGKSPDSLVAESITARHGMLADDVSDLAIDPVLSVAWITHGSGVSRYYRKDLRFTESFMTDSSKVDVVAYPVPFRPKVHAKFIIDHIAEDAVVGIYNRGGALVRSFKKNDVIGGRLEWDGNGKDGRLVAPGVYYYVVNKGSKTEKGKFIIIH